MTFFANEPKIKRLARNLKSELQAYHQRRWAEYLTVLKAYDMEAQTTVSRRILQENFEMEVEDSRARDNAEVIRATRNTPSWFRKKEDFDWSLFNDPDHRGIYHERNARKQEEYYEDQVKRAQKIIGGLNQATPNYREIRRLVKAIKQASTTVPCAGSGSPITIQITPFTGGNLLVDFFSGIAGLIHASLFFLASVFFIPFYVKEKSHYCGGPQFFLDTASYFCDSLCKVISTVFFPLAILRSHYETGSYNPCKGSLMRLLDSIDALAEEQLSQQRYLPPGLKAFSGESHTLGS